MFQGSCTTAVHVHTVTGCMLRQQLSCEIAHMIRCVLLILCTMGLSVRKPCVQLLLGSAPVQLSSNSNCELGLACTASCGAVL